MIGIFRKNPTGSMDTFMQNKNCSHGNIQYSSSRKNKIPNCMFLFSVSTIAETALFSFNKNLRALKKFEKFLRRTACLLTQTPLLQLFNMLKEPLQEM